jgi:Xaa-Pro aminopeptidase
MHDWSALVLGRAISEIGIIRKKFFEDKGYKISFMNENLVDPLWETRPTCYKDIFVHEEWAGTSAADKIKWVQNKITELKGNGALFTDLSEICWVLNVRSSEIPYNPFMKSVLLVGKQGEKHTLFLPEAHPCHKEISKELEEHFARNNVQIKPYPYTPLPEGLLYRKKSCNFDIFQSLVAPIDWSSIGVYRAARHPKEQDGFRSCHIRDGIAMAGFWGWRSKKESVGEFEAAEEIDRRRHLLKHNRGLSFDTISGGGPNAAIVHYHPSNNPDFIITKDMIHLLDSGGQYLDGTTDVTRTFHFGNPTDAEKDAYTRVLLGNLDVERLVWPKDSDIHGGDIDVLARRRLWQNKLDYGHGTGHGVGHFEGVHEGPCGISKYNSQVFAPGMIVSNEPGYYE